MKNLILCNIFAAFTVFGVTAMQDGASSTGEPAGSPLRRIGSSIQLREVDDFAQRTVFDIPVVPCKDSKTGTTKASKPKTKEDIEKEIRPMLQTCIDRLGSKRLVSDKRGNKIEVEVIDISCRSIMRYARRVQDQVDEKYELIPFLDLVDTIISRIRGSDDWAQTAFVGDELEQFHRRFCGSQLWFRGLIHPKVADNLRSFYRNFTTFQTFASLFIVDALNRSGGKIAFAAPLSLEIDIKGDVSACAFEMNVPELRRVTIYLSEQCEKNFEEMGWALNHECLHVLQYQLFGYDFASGFVFGCEVESLANLTCLNSKHDFEDLFFSWLNKCASSTVALSKLTKKAKSKQCVMVPELPISYDMHCNICKLCCQMRDNVREFMELNYKSLYALKQGLEAIKKSCNSFLAELNGHIEKFKNDIQIMNGKEYLPFWKQNCDNCFKEMLNQLSKINWENIDKGIAVMENALEARKAEVDKCVASAVQSAHARKELEGRLYQSLRQLSLSYSCSMHLIMYMVENAAGGLCNKEKQNEIKKICEKYGHSYEDNKDAIIRIFNEVEDSLNEILYCDSDVQKVRDVLFCLLNGLGGVCRDIEAQYRRYIVQYGYYICEIQSGEIFSEKYTLDLMKRAMMISMARLWNTNYSDKLVIGGLLPISDTLWIVNDQHECIQAKRDRMIKGATVCKNEKEWGVYRPHCTACIDKQFFNKMTDDIRQGLTCIFHGLNLQNADVKVILNFISDLHNQGAFYPQALMHVEHPRTSEVESVEEEPTKDVTD